MPPAQRFGAFTMLVVVEQGLTRLSCSCCGPLATFPQSDHGAEVVATRLGLHCQTHVAQVLGGNVVTKVAH